MSFYKNEYYSLVTLSPVFQMNFLFMNFMSRNSFFPYKERKERQKNSAFQHELVQNVACFLSLFLVRC